MFYQPRDNKQLQMDSFTEAISTKKDQQQRGNLLPVGFSSPQQYERSFTELWEYMDMAYERYAIEQDEKELTKAIADMQLTDVITMVRHNLHKDLPKALKSSSITNVATKITLMFKPIIRWKLKLHVFLGKNTYSELVHYHPYKMSSKVLSGSFVSHSYSIRDTKPDDAEADLQNEYLIPGVKRADKDGKPIKLTGKKHVSLLASKRCSAGTVQEYPIEEPHSLEYDSIANGKVVTVAFISPTIFAEAKGYDRNLMTETRRIGFDNEVHLQGFLEETLLHLYLVKLKEDLCSGFTSRKFTLTKNEEYLMTNINKPNSVEHVLLPLLAEFILQDKEENEHAFSPLTIALFSQVLQETSNVAVFNAISCNQQVIEDFLLASK